MNPKIIITGATGLIGSELTRILSEKNYDITVFTRNIKKSAELLPFAKKHFDWISASSDEISMQLESAYSIINLAGTSIAAKKWTESYKNEIYNSRIEGTNKIVNAIKLCKIKPKSLINASAVGFYGNQGDTTLFECFQQGTGFLSKVTGDWEKAAENCPEDVRLAKVRIGVVLDKNGGILEKMLPAFKLFVGGVIGSGEQWLSWIHSSDLVNMFIFIIENEEISGAVNCVSPYPVRMKTFASTLGTVLKRPSCIRVPECILKVLLGESAEIVISSQKVIPAKAIKHGFKYNFENIEDALKAIFQN
jgi:uncharacterized protein (TIGR01777 family)